MNKILSCLITVLLLLTVDSKAQLIDSLLNNKREYYAVDIGSDPEPKIDGLLDDEIWKLGEWQGNFTQQQPVGNTPGTEKTYIKLLYNYSNLFIAIICLDKEPDRIRNILDRRDSFSGDMSGVALDSRHDLRTAYEFNVSAAGQKTDLMHLGDYQWDFDWNAVWDGASSTNDSGWIAEIKVPFSQLRYGKAGEQVWGMHVWRWIERKHEEDQWQYIPLEAPAMVYLFGELKGISNIRDSRQVEFLPYALGSWSDFTADNRYKFNAGLDAKVGIRSNYTLDLSINPDYGQVEADPSVLNLTAFETFFDEKRPFFLEGNDIFDFELDGDIPYYSRRIGSAPVFPDYYHDREISDIPDHTTILGAAKFTGKNEKGLSVGLVNGLTASEFGVADPGSDHEEEIMVAPMSNYLASRVKREFNKGNSIAGGVFTMMNRISADSVSSELLPSSALSGGVDFLHYWNNRDYFFEAKSIVSQLNGSPESILIKQLAHNHRFQRPDAGHLTVDSLKEHLSGNGSLFRIGKKGGQWNFILQGQYRSPGLNLNDIGYIRQSDFFAQQAEVSYEMNDPGKWLRNYKIKLIQETLWSFGGEPIGNLQGLELEGMNNSLWWLNTFFRYELSHLDTRELRGGPAIRIDPQYHTGLSVGSNNSRNFYGNLGYYRSGFGSKGSGNHTGEMGLTWLPIRRIRLSGHLSMSLFDYHQQYASTVNGTLADYYVVGNLDRRTTSFTLRAEVFLTPELSLQYYGSPYYSTGKYDKFWVVEQSHSKDPESRLKNLDVTYDPVSNAYAFVWNTENLEFGNPDFSFMQFRSNLVFRWEYMLGSTLYLVWSHDRSSYESFFNPVKDIMNDLFRLKGNNVIMLKINFWFSL